MMLKRHRMKTFALFVVSAVRHENADGRQTISDVNIFGFVSSTRIFSFRSKKNFFGEFFQSFVIQKITGAAGRVKSIRSLSDETVIKRNVRRTTTNERTEIFDNDVRVVVAFQKPIELVEKLFRNQTQRAENFFRQFQIFFLNFFPEIKNLERINRSINFDRRRRAANDEN